MNKKIFGIIASLILMIGIFALTGCQSSEKEAAEPVFSDEYTAYTNYVDLNFTKKVMKKISSFGDDSAVGMRSAGSPAEKETCDYLEGVMKDIGLKNVTVEEARVDGWTFNGASLTYKDINGEKVKADLGGYQTTIQADKEELEIVYVGHGTAADYEGLDVKGKLVLYEVDQSNEYWINWPAKQAKQMGARCSIAMSVFADDMNQESDERIGVQDICGPADAPVLAISNKDCKAIKRAIKASGEDSIKVVLNADSQVTFDSKTHNLWGEIPGKTSETLFVFAHMDGYFHSAYDDAQGVAVSLSQAKALIDSGYTPEKTIRFCIHGAEEWGRSGNEYDWSTGAYEEINTTHPEWVNGAFAIVNNDGGYAVQGEENNGVMSSVELRDFLKDSMKDVITNFPNWSYGNVTVNTEDFYWTRVGIPSISAGTMEENNYDKTGYHSTFDSFDAQPLDEDALADTVNAYGKVILDLDSLSVRPMDFSDRLKAFEKSLNRDARNQFQDVLTDGYAAADALNAKMKEVEKSGDEEAALELNEQTQEIYIAFQEATLGMDFYDVENKIKHVMYQDNISYCNGAINALRDGNIQEAYDDYLSCIDWSWYDMCFDEATSEYMKNQLFENRDDSWGKDLIAYPHADTRDIVVSLGEKYEQNKGDVSEDISALRALKKQQQNYLDETYASEYEGLKKAVDLMKKNAE